ncbi:UNVERIFIED_CONTAM: hypothetical protein GTU68_007439 [Idotea baltica]|nr:hypothetical protein [Idotea baltica]
MLFICCRFYKRI